MKRVLLLAGEYPLRVCCARNEKPSCIHVACEHMYYFRIGSSTHGIFCNNGPDCPYQKSLPDATTLEKLENYLLDRGIHGLVSEERGCQCLLGDSPRVCKHGRDFVELGCSLFQFSPERGKE